MVNGSPLTLAVGAVTAEVTVHGGSLIKVDAIVLQCVNQHLHCAGNLPLGVRILHTEKQHASALVGHPLGGEALHKVAQMDKAGGGGSHTGDDRALRHLTGGIHLFKGFGRVGNVGKQKIGKSLIVHSYYLFTLSYFT